ncbi:MAG: hypothetical protein FWE50_01270 [Alphaproteobacteria bacterium]|nr:hypothetical protein [Alphaproteobacteria bacterium]
MLHIDPRDKLVNKKVFHAWLVVAGVVVMAILYRLCDRNGLLPKENEDRMHNSDTNSTGQDSVSKETTQPFDYSQFFGELGKSR